MLLEVSDARHPAHRWLVALAGVATQMIVGSAYAWSVFKKPFMEKHGWLGEQVGLAFTLVVLFTGLAAALGGRFVDRAGGRRVAMLAATSFGLGALLTGVADATGSRLLLYLGYGVIGGIGSGLGYVTPISVLVRWFPDRRGLVTGLVVSGVGVGAALIGQIAPFLLARFGLAHTFYLFGGSFLVILWSAARLLENPPTGWNPPMAFRQKPSFLSSSVDACGALSMYQFYILWSVFFLNATAGVALISNLAVIAQESCGITPLAAGTVVLASFIGDGTGRIVWSALSDRLGRKAVFLLLFATEIPLFYALPNVSNPITFSLVAAIILSCFGGAVATMPAYAADTFGPKNIGQIYGKILLAWVVAGLVGPMLMESIRTNSGSFHVAMRAASGLLSIAFVLNCLYRPPVALAAADVAAPMPKS